MNLNRARWVLSAAWAAILAASATAESVKTFEFEAHRFSMQVPAAYSTVTQESRGPIVKTFGFTAAERRDGTRSMIQVSLMDLARLGQKEMPTLEKYVTSMVAGVRDRRTQWTQKASPVKVSGVPATRVEWSGTASPGPGRGPVLMRGVMIAGLKDGVGFTLHTQDLASFAPTALPAGEKAMMTFSLVVKR